MCVRSDAVTRATRARGAARDGRRDEDAHSARTGVTDDGASRTLALVGCFTRTLRRSWGSR
jgi:hypothetical protein